jgi:hypothetical protein
LRLKYEKLLLERMVLVLKLFDDLVKLLGALLRLSLIGLLRLQGLGLGPGLFLLHLLSVV